MFGFLRKVVPIEPWMVRLWDWADKAELPPLSWEKNSFNRDGGYWVGFPRDARRLIGLEGLNVGSMGVFDLPPEIGNLKKLRKIWAFENNLQEFPGELCNLPSLVELDLSKNRITTLPSEILNLRNLEKLELKENLIDDLPLSLPTMRSLQYLDLRGQPIGLNLAVTPLSDELMTALSSMSTEIRW